MTEDRISLALHELASGQAKILQKLGKMETDIAVEISEGRNRAADIQELKKTMQEKAAQRDLDNLRLSISKAVWFAAFAVVAALGSELWQLVMKLPR